MVDSWFQETIRRVRTREDETQKEREKTQSQPESSPHDVEKHGDFSAGP